MTVDPASILPSVSIPKDAHKQQSEDSLVSELQNICCNALSSGHIDSFTDLFLLLHPEAPCSLPLAALSSRNDHSPLISDITSLSSLSLHLTEAESALDQSSLTSLYSHSLSASTILTEGQSYPLAIKMIERSVSVAESSNDSHSLLFLASYGISVYTSFIHHILSNPFYCFDVSCVAPDALDPPSAASVQSLVSSDAYLECSSLYRTAVSLGDLGLEIIYNSGNVISSSKIKVIEPFRNVPQEEVLQNIRDLFIEAGNFLSLDPNFPKNDELLSEIISLNRKALSLTTRINSEFQEFNDNQSKFISYINLARSLSHSDLFEAVSCCYSAIDSVSADPDLVVLACCTIVKYLATDMEANADEISSAIKKAELFCGDSDELKVKVSELTAFLLTRGESYSKAVPILQNTYDMALRSPDKSINRKALKLSLGIAKSQQSLEEIFKKMG
ncbi:hypothetical protein GEMRC1_007461 [Eukaryota sp. GEM-RC1]